MNAVKRSLVLWIIALLVTLGSAAWQRLTGPTHPLRINTEVAGQEVRGRLIRSQNIDVAVPIDLRAGAGLGGDARWRRWPGEHPWHEVALVRERDRLVGSLPPQSATAARIEYEIRIRHQDGETLTIPARLRFKGPVPAPVLAVHVVAMFLGMLFSLRAGLEAISRGPRLLHLAAWTVGFLVVGGLILGPVVQKYAFNAYWTGWPVGEDLTDNKLATAVLFWVIALWQVSRGRRWWAVLAALITIGIYLIPHSMHGSTHDWETGRHIQAALRWWRPLA
jgi:hypothetical protein